MGIINQGLIMTLVGMSGVFFFLVMLVYATKLTSSIVSKYFPAKSTAPPVKKKAPAPSIKTVDANADNELEHIAAVIAIAQQEFKIPVK